MEVQYSLSRTNGLWRLGDRIHARRQQPAGTQELDGCARVDKNASKGPRSQFCAGGGERRVPGVCGRWRSDLAFLVIHCRTDYLLPARGKFRCRRCGSRIVRLTRSVCGNKEIYPNEIKEHDVENAVIEGTASPPEFIARFSSLNTECSRPARWLSNRCEMVSLPLELNRDASNAAGIAHTLCSLDPGRWEWTVQMTPSARINRRGTACRCHNAEAAISDSAFPRSGSSRL